MKGTRIIGSQARDASGSRRPSLGGRSFAEGRVRSSLRCGQFGPIQARSALLLVTSACTGQVSGSSQDPAPAAEIEPTRPASSTQPSNPDETPTRPPGTPAVDVYPDLPETAIDVGLHRLSHTILARSLESWLQAWGVENPIPLSNALPAEERARSFANNGEALTLDPRTFAAWFDAAEANGPGIASALRARCSDRESRNCARSVIEAVGRLSHRRTLGENEVETYLSIYDGLGADAAFAAAVTAVLISPDVLYRVESADTERPATPLELASRLAAFLWSSAPDEALLDAAESGALGEPELYRREVTRMLAAPQARAGLAWFYEQWLELDAILAANKDPEIFVEWQNDYPVDMYQEMVELLEQLTFEGEGGRFRDLFTTQAVLPIGSLATFYNLPPSSTPDFLPERPGILTRGAFLARHGFQQTAPVLRGYWVREQLLCDLVPPAPDDADNVPPPFEEGATTRERTEARTGGSCAGCHQLMNDLGYAFEGFDAAGKPRAFDAGKAVDTTGRAIGTDIEPFDGPEELQRRLAASEVAQTCFIRQLFRFGLGRLESQLDRTDLEALRTAFSDEDGRLLSLVAALTETEAFRTVRPQP